MLSNAYFLANVCFDTAENEPAKNLQKKLLPLNVGLHDCEAEDGLPTRRESLPLRRRHFVLASLLEDLTIFLDGRFRRFKKIPATLYKMSATSRSNFGGIFSAEIHFHRKKST